MAPAEPANGAGLSLAEISDSLCQSDQGIWVAGETRTLSYPDAAREWLFSLEDESWWFRHRNALICNLVGAFPPAGEIFDIGGGNGVVSCALERAGHPVVLLEPGAAGARNARSRGLSHVVCSTLQEAGFRPGSLPAAGLFDVIEHIEDDVGFLRELDRCVADGGRIYASVPAHAWLWSAEDDFAGHLNQQSRLVTSLLDLTARVEAYRVGQRKRIPFGASILAVARSNPRARQAASSRGRLPEGVPSGTIPRCP